MNSHAPDRSRDRRIEDPTNLWIIHPAGALAAAVVPRARHFGERGVGRRAMPRSAGRARLLRTGDRWPLACIGLLAVDGLADRRWARRHDRPRDRHCQRRRAVPRRTLRPRRVPADLCRPGRIDRNRGGMDPRQLARACSTRCSRTFTKASARVFTADARASRPQRRRPSPNPLVRTYDRVWGLVDRFALRFDEALGAAIQTRRSSEPHMAPPLPSRCG